MRYAASDLRHRATLQVLTTTTNDDFEEVEQLTDVATVRGELLPMTGRETMRAESIDEEARAMWVMRYRDWVTTDHVLVHRGQVYEIHSVVDVEGRGRYLELVLTKRTR